MTIFFLQRMQNWKKIFWTFILFLWTHSTLWPFLQNSVPKLGHEFLLLWLNFHSVSKNSCFQSSKICGSFTKFWIFWSLSKIAFEGAKFQAWVLRQKFPKLATVLCRCENLFLIVSLILLNNFISEGGWNYPVPLKKCILSAFKQ